MARLAPAHQLRDPGREKPGRDVGLPLIRVSPGVIVGINCRVDRAHRCACFAQRKCDDPLTLIPPSASCDLLEGAHEPIESAVFFETNFQLSEIEILRVSKTFQKEPVHDLGQCLVPASDPPVGGDVEYDSVSRDILGDLSQVDANLAIICPSRESFARGFHGRYRDSRSRGPSILAKLDLPEPKKPETQIAMPSLGLLRAASVAFEYLNVVVSDGVGDDVLIDLRPNDLGIGLIDLDNFFDLARDVIGEEAANLGTRHCLPVRRSWGGSCVRPQALP